MRQSPPAALASVAVDHSTGLANPRAHGNWRQDGLVQAGRAALWASLLTVAMPAVRLGGLTVSDLFLLVATAIALREIPKRSGNLLPWLTVGGIWLFLVGALLSSFSAANPLGGLAVTARLALVTLSLPLTIACLLSGPGDFRKAAGLWSASVVISGSFALGQVAVQGEFLSFAPHWGRSTGATAHPNDLGLAMAVGLVMLPATLGWWPPLARPAIIAITLLALLTSGSTGALVAVLAGAVVYALVSRLPLVGIAGGALVLVVAVLLSTQYQLGPLARTAAVFGEQGTVESRVETFLIALEMIDRNPIVGVGFVPGNVRTESGYTVHNAVLGAWYQGGILAAIGLVILFISPFFVSDNIRGALNTTKIRDSLLSAHITFLVMAMTGSQFYQRFGWLPAALWISWCLHTRIARGDRRP